MYLKLIFSHTAVRQNNRPDGAIVVYHFSGFTPRVLPNDQRLTLLLNTWRLHRLTSCLQKAYFTLTLFAVNCKNLCKHVGRYTQAKK